jgi:hypothetical protein
MTGKSQKSPTSSDLGATDRSDGGRRFLIGAQFGEIRRKRADIDAKLRQMTEAEREKRGRRR